MKIAIVVGHNARRQGAVSIDGTSEFKYNSQLAELIEDHDPDAVKVFFRTFGGGYSRQIDRVCAAVDAWNADCLVALHFNGFARASPSGTLTLSSGSPKSLELAGHVHPNMVSVMGLRDRGVEVRRRHQRGGRILWNCRAPAILVEPFFGSNPEDWRRAQSRMDYLAEAIYRGARDFCKGD